MVFQWSGLVFGIPAPTLLVLLKLGRITRPSITICRKLADSAPRQIPIFWMIMAITRQVESSYSCFRQIMGQSRKLISVLSSAPTRRVVLVHVFMADGKIAGSSILNEEGECNVWNEVRWERNIYSEMFGIKASFKTRKTMQYIREKALYFMGKVLDNWV